MAEYKVGDRFRRITKSGPCFTEGKIYEIHSVTRGEVVVIDDTERRHWLSHRDIRSHFEVVSEESESQPDVTDLIANLGRRVHELEGADAVNSPQHYTQGAVEVIDYIDQVTDGYEGKQAYYVGNIVKYVSRAPHKNGVEDAKKAAWYLSRLIDVMETGDSE